MPFASGYFRTTYARDIRLVDTVCVTSYGAGETGGAAQVQSGVQVLKSVTGDGAGAWKLLAPEIVEAILDGRQSAELQLDDLLYGFPLKWEEQHQAIMIDRDSSGVR